MTSRTKNPHRPTPAHWQLFFDQKGIRSISHLAEIAGVSGMTANRLVHGDMKTRPEILRQVAAALRVDDSVIYGLAGWPTTTQPWEPPAEAEAMDDRQRKAITELIRAFVRPSLDQARLSRAAGQESEGTAQEEQEATIHELRPTREGHGLAAWKRDGDRPSEKEYLDGMGEEPQD